MLCDELLENDDPGHKADGSDFNFKSNKHLFCVNTINRGGEWLGGTEELVVENKHKAGIRKSNDEYFNDLILMIENATKEL